MSERERDEITTPLWAPTASEIKRAQFTAFLNTLRARNVVPANVTGMHELQHWSVNNSEVFWEEIWRAMALIATPRADGTMWERTLVNGEVMMPPHGEDGPHWFTDASLNFAENLLRRRDDHPALIAWTELGRSSRTSYRELAHQVARLRAALVAEGVGAGDRVVGYLPNIPHAVVAMLAATSLGAIWSSCSPDFGTKGVLDRFGQIEPRVLIVANGYRYAGKLINCRERTAEVVAAIPSLRAVWEINNLPEIGMSPGLREWSDVMQHYQHHTELEFVRLPFNHPLYILYSSGTTGLPKCLVHGAGGTLLQHWKEQALHTDIGREDVFFYFTTCGWMMWNWLVSGLMLGSTVVLYDGAPLSPDPNILLRMAQDEKISVFGVSAKYLAVLEKESPEALSQYDLSSVRAILSTGSPLAANSYDFVYKHLTHGVRLTSMSGGTDIVSCFALGDPTGMVWRGELQTRGLGMAVDVFNEAAQAVRGEPGELACTKPFPSMPVAFWDDDDGSRYRSAYFDHFPGVWRHGDWCEITEHDGFVIHGRSDATLNPGGVRIGTAEVYRQVEQIPEVLESLVVEQTLTGAGGTDSRMVLFVRMRVGHEFTETVKQSIRRRLREHATPHHVPKVIIAVADIPRTISGKITELAVREIIHNRPVKNVDALANPEALELFTNLPELRGN
ncbi:MAG: acetoacetate--CoA ligase [Gemmatimonadaceae bacterium]